MFRSNRRHHKQTAPHRKHGQYGRRVLVAAAAAITVGAFSPSARSGTVTWLPNADGFWNVASNWSSNPFLPLNNDDVIISVGGATVRTITHSVGTDSIRSLSSDEIIVLSGGSLGISSASTINADFDVSGGSLQGAGSLTVNGTLNWSGGTLGSSSTALVRAAGSLKIDTSGATVTLNRTLENDTSATWTGGSNFIFSGATFNNIAAASFTASATGTITSTGGGNTFNNAGTFNRTGAGTTSIATIFNNSGSVNVQGGTLALSGGGTQSGQFVISAGADLALGGGHTLGAASGITGAGNLDFTAGINAASGLINIGGVMTVSGGTNTFNTAVTAGSLVASGGIGNFNTPFSLGSLTLSGADLSGSAIVSVNGPMTWSAGTMSGTGKTIVAAGQSLTLNSSASALALHRALENDGTTNWDSGTNAISFNGGTFNNAAGGVFSASANASMTSAGGVNLFANSGTFNHTGAAITTIGIPFNNTALGTVNVQGGTLALAGGGTSSGAFNISSGGTLNFTAGVHALSAGATVSGAGALVVSGATVTTGDAVNVGEADLTSGTWTVNGPATLNSGSMTNGVLTGSGTVTLPGAFTWSRGTMSGGGKTVIGPAGTLGIDTSAANVTLSRVMENNGTVNWSGDLNAIFLTGGSFNNQLGGVFNDSAASTIHNNGAGNLFNNAGTYNRLGAGIATIVAPFSNTGTLNVQGGTLTFTGSVAQIAGANLTGGTWNISSGATLDIPLATITANGGNITLDGFNSTFASINGLTSNSGSFTIKNGRNFNTAGAFSNAGTLAVGQGSTFTMAAGQAYNQSAGATNLQGGTLAADAGVNISGGSLSGSGAVSGNTTIGGKLAPAGNIAITGSLTLGAASQSLFALGGIAAGAFDTVNVSGNAALAGTLGVSFANGFQASIKGSDSFTILTAGSPLTGAFSNIASGSRLATSDGFGKFRVIYSGATGVTLTDFNTVRWVPDADGDWSAVANWTSNPVLPAPIEDVIIDVGGATVRTVTHSTGVDSINSLTSNENLVVSGGSLSIAQASTINAGLTLSGGTLSGSGDVAVNGALTWSNGGTMSGTGRTIVASGGTLSLDTSAAGITLSRILENNGTATWIGDNAWNFSGGTFNNKSGATLSVTGSGTMTNAGGVNAFNNAGTFNRSGAGTTTVAIPFNNSGSVDVQGGTLAVTGGGTNSGTITVNGGATLNLTDYTYAASSNLTGAGTINFSGVHNLPAGTFSPTGTVNFNSGTITVNNTITPAALGPISSATVNFNAAQSFPSLTLSGGTLAGSGDVAITSALSWSGGAMSGNGKTAIGPAGSLGIDTSASSVTLSRVLENNGAASWTGGNAWLFNGGTFNNQFGATFGATNSATVSSTGGINAFNNAGTFNRSGAGTTTIGIPFNNTGSVNVQGGTLAMNGGGTNSGVISVNSGATLSLSDYSYVAGSNLTGAGTINFSGVHNLPAGTFNPTGTVNFNSGTISVNNAIAPAAIGPISSATVNFNAPQAFSALTLSGGTLAGSGDVTMNGTLSWTGGAMSGTGKTSIAPAASLGIDTSASGLTLSRILENNGTTTWTGGNAVSFNGGTFNNQSGANSNTSGTGTVTNTGGVNAFNNFGVLNRTGAGSTTIGVPFNNAGTINAQGGTLTLSGGVGQVSGTALTGGTWNVTGGSTLDIPGVNLTSNAANVTLNGPGSAFPAVNSLTSNSGSLTITNARNFTTAGAFSNSGTLTIGAGSTFSTAPAQAYTQSAGNTNLQAGALAAPGGVNINGGSLTGNGTITGNLAVGGTLSPGNSAGNISVSGNLNLGGTAQSVFELGGTSAGSFDTVTVTGSATVGGTLGVSFINGFQTAISKTDTFAILTSGTQISGAFANVANGARVKISGGPGSLLASYSGNSVVLSSFYTGPAWMPDANGDWALASNWSTAPALPGAADDVLIDVGGATVRTITHSTGVDSINSLTSNENIVMSGGSLSIAQPSTINAGLTLSGGTLAGSGDVTVNGPLTWGNGGTMSGTGKTIVASGGTLSLDTSTAGITLSRVLENNGTGTWTGANAWTFNGGTFNNQAGATLTTGAAAAITNGGGVNVFSNAGILKKIAATTLDINIPLNNSGSVSVQGGTLDLNGAGTVNAGNVDVAAAAVVNFANDSSHTAGSSITGAGAVNFTGGTHDFAGQLLATGPVSVAATVNFNATQNISGPLTLTGTVGGTANVTASNSLNWLNGSMSGTGHTIIPANATLNLGGAGALTLSRTLDNAGTANYTGGGINFNGGTFNNNAGASFNAGVAGAVFNAGGTNVFNNAGTLNKTSAAAFDINVPFSNTGTVNAQAGTLNLAGGVAQQVGGTLTGGTWKVQDNAAINIAIGSDITTNNATVSLNGVNSSFARLNALTTNNGSLNILGGRTFQTAGDLNNTGLIAVGPNSLLDVHGALTNTNLIDVSGKLIAQATAATRDSVLTDITHQIQSARNTHPALWQGTGITSSAAAADARAITGLAVIVNDKGNGTPLYASFGGQPVDTNSILVKYTYNGDANLDGFINFDDYFQINTGFLSNGKLTGYRWGDFNYDGLINFDDYFLINSAFLNQGSTVLSVHASAVQAVPEPAATTLLLVLGVGLLRRRSRSVVKCMH